MANRFRDPIVKPEEEKKVEQPEMEIGQETQQKQEAVKEEPVAPAPKKKENKEASNRPQNKWAKIMSGIGRIVGGDVLKDKSVLKSIPLMLLILFYFILMVSNRYYVETLTKEKIKTTERISYLREHKIQMQKNYQKSIKISEIAEKLDTLEIGLTAGPPYEL